VQILAANRHVWMPRVSRMPMHDVRSIRYITF
jgi:hypothetical protein